MGGHGLHGLAVGHELLHEVRTLGHRLHPGVHDLPRVGPLAEHTTQRHQVPGGMQKVDGEY